jgi:hypothetical protein
LKEAVMQTCRETEFVKERTEKERAKHPPGTEHMQITINSLSRKPKHETHQISGETGEMGKVYAALRSKFSFGADRR